jgi:NAD dependent epimerase/dehydratase family enzyme
MPFYFFAGGPVAAGQQYMSWITLNDWVRLALWAIDSPNVSGAVNATAPNPVPSKEFARAIGRAVHRPSWAPVPGFVLRLLFGEMAQNILILGQRVVPKRTMELGFRFEDDQIEAALKRVLG